jgi:hypothetical protein
MQYVLRPGAHLVSGHIAAQERMRAGVQIVVVAHGERALGGMCVRLSVWHPPQIPRRTDVFVKDAIMDGARLAVVLPLIALADSADYRSGADAGRALAVFADVPRGS